MRRLLLAIPAVLLLLIRCASPLASSEQSSRTSTPSLALNSPSFGERIESGRGYRLDESGVMVVHLRGGQAEMQTQYRELLADEIAGFQTASRDHRGLQPYLGGCSNIAAFGPASVGGTLWHGRNFDFSGHSVLDEFRVVYIMEPEGKIPYVTVSWSGPYPWNYQGVQTAMNARGLSLGYMLSTAEGESLDSVPTLWELYRNVIEDAETIDQAVSILTAGPRRGAANLLIADGKVPDAVVVEMTSRSIAVRKAEDGTVYSTNHFVSNKLFYSENKDPDSLARFQRLDQLAAADAGSFDLSRMISVLRDRTDIHTGASSPEGDIIGSPFTMLSVVFHPSDLTFWVANGPAPASYRRFVGFSLTDELNGKSSAGLPAVDADTSLDASAWAEIDAYQAGLRAYYRGDDAAAAGFFSKAIAFRPVSPLYAYRLAGALMNLHRYNEAIAALNAGLKGDPQSAYRAYIYYRLGLIYEEQGNAKEMRAAFQQVLAIDVGDNEIESYARRALGQ